MSEIVIRAEGLGKKYLIGHEAKAERNATLRDVISRTAKGFARSAVDMARGRQLVAGDDVEEFWALKDVSFEIKRGDVVGIIGRNGAGKSTLLKILSRITEPSEGRVEIRGRVASLLEVGTGFHPELTGRENVYLNGAILGMSRVEIRRKFDEIVAFAEVERFLDTPVKRYSSGMYVRLAFSVAAYLEPEILLVDEVLAVGDLEFQDKCLGKMQTITSAGRTVFFVSHNLAAIRQLAPQTLAFASGRLIFQGETNDAINRYMCTKSSDTRSQLSYNRAGAENSDCPKIATINVRTSSGTPLHTFAKPLQIYVTLRHPAPLKNACLSFQILDHLKNPIVHATAYPPEVRFGRTGESSELQCIIPQPRLNVGRYSLTCYFSGPPGGELWDVVEDVCAFTVERSDRAILFGWREDACKYIEDFYWTVSEPTKNAGID